jgi:hypothetical protein
MDVAGCSTFFNGWSACFTLIFCIHLHVPGYRPGDICGNTC